MNKDTLNVQEFKFPTFSDVSDKKKTQTFEFRELTGTKVSSKVPTSNVIRREREHASQSSFDISPIVKKSRGIVEQEHEDYEQRVNSEIQRRLDSIKEEAYQDGYNSGLEKGHEDAFHKAVAEYEDRIEVLTRMVQEVQSYRVDLLKNQRQEIYKTIKTLTKWVLLKEIKNDDYIKDLLEKLILELHSKSDLIIKVNESSFERMPEVLEIVQKKVGVLTNVRIEINKGMDRAGIVLESQNGIIDGSLEAQFKNIDKIFESTGLLNE